MKKLISPLLFSILVLTTTVYSQNDFRGIVSDDFRQRFDDYGFSLSSDILGARGMGMGGANIAAANDPTAVYFNPASLSALNGLNITISGKMIFDSQDHQQPPLGGFSARTAITPMLTPDFGTISYSFPIGSRTFSAALGYRAFLDQNIKMESTHFYFGGGRIAEEEINRGGIYAISPSLAIDILPSLAIGATFNKITGKSDFEIKLVSPYAEDFQFFKFKDKEEYSGANLEVGTVWRATSWLNLGATFSPKWTLTTEEAAEELQITEDVYDAPSVITTPDDQLATYKFKIPAEIGFGISIKPLPNTIIAADIKKQNWADATTTSNLDDLNEITGLLENSINWHAGVEQLIAGTKWDIPVRLGFFSIQSPYQDRLFRGAYQGKQIVQNGWSAGVGIHKSSYGFDFAFVRSSYNYDWWMTSSDYYNKRMFVTRERLNRVLLSFTLKL